MVKKRGPPHEATGRKEGRTPPVSAGVVLSYEGAGAHTLIEVNFAGAGRKRLVLAYANLTSFG